MGWRIFHARKRGGDYRDWRLNRSPVKLIPLGPHWVRTIFEIIFGSQKFKGITFENNGERAGTRTQDPLIKSLMDLCFSGFLRIDGLL
jgi:hypothetical protein